MDPEESLLKLYQNQKYNKSYSLYINNKKKKDLLYNYNKYCNEMPYEDFLKCIDKDDNNKKNYFNEKLDIS